MKSEKQWAREVQVAFKKWKEKDVGAYDKFRKWNDYHRTKYFQAKKHEQGFSERQERLIYGN